MFKELFILITIKKLVAFLGVYIWVYVCVRVRESLFWFG